MSADPQNRIQSSGASDDSLMQVHARLQNQKPEKPNGYSAMPLALLGIMCTAIFLGSIYLVHHSIRFDPLVTNEHAKRAKPGVAGATQLTRAQMGKRIFLANCAACHQPTGQGIPGQYPPLAGSEWAQGNEERIIRIVLHGLNGPLVVEGKEFNNVMAPLGGVLKDEQIANVLSYIRSEWGNKAPEVQPETVSKVRGETASRNTYWTADELHKIGGN